MFKKTEHPSGGMTLYGAPLLWGMVAGALCVSLLLFAAAGICVAVDVSDSLVAGMAFCACGLGALCGGLMAGKRAKRQGWLLGLLCGCGLTLLVAGIGSLCVGTVFSGRLLLCLLICVVCATLGGILGVNWKRNDFSV